jgi:peroxiredoxin
MSNHLGDTNKMVSETPRTDDRAVIIDGNPWVNAPFARQLERELNAANQRIQRLEDGDAALTYSIGLDLQKENEALKARIKRLEEAAMMALHGCYNGPMPDHVRDAIADAMEAKP